jgi:hypothetical protein
LESFWEPLGTFLGENGREGGPNRTKAMHFDLNQARKTQDNRKKRRFFRGKIVQSSKKCEKLVVLA